MSERLRGGAVATYGAALLDGRDVRISLASEHGIHLAQEPLRTGETLLNTCDLGRK